MKKNSSKVIDDLLDEITPVEMQQTKMKMLIAARMDDRMKELGINKVGFAMKLNKNPSEITKWLSGTQNFTIEILVEICSGLEMELGHLLRSDEVKTTITIPYQCCPVCNGQGRTIADGFTSNFYQTCKVCKGAMVLPMATQPFNFKV